MEKILEDKIKYLHERLVTGREFNKILQEIVKSDSSNRTHIQYVLKDKDNNSYIYGTKGEGEAKDTRGIELEDGYQLNISLWKGTQMLSIDRCAELFREFWNVGYCDAVSGLLSADRKAFNDKCENTFSSWQEDGKKLAFFMMDLDHFKDVNTKYEHAIGTDVLSEFSRLLFSEIYDSAILIHQSGDEFNLIFSYEYPYEVIDVAKRVRFKVYDNIFRKAPDISLTLATGVWLTEQERISFMEARKRAEKTYDPKIKNQTKQRDSIRVNKEKNEEEFGDNSVELAFARMKCNIHNKEMFRNIYLSYLSYYASEKETVDERFCKEINEILDWMNPQWVNLIRCTKKSRHWDTKERLSAIETGLAIFQGLLRNPSVEEKSLHFSVSKQGKPHVTIRVDDVEVVRLEIPSMGEEDMEWDCPRVRHYEPEINLKRTVLVQCGYHDLKIPDDIFNHIVKVDTRPTTGGRLPDFWEAALCELINTMCQSPYFTDIVMFGDMENTKKVRMYLERIDQWAETGNYQYQYIAKKTYKTVWDIIEFQKKFTDHIFICKSEEELIRHVYEQCRTESCLEEVKHELPKIKNRRFLERKLSYENIILGKECGCKAKTIAEAFPTVLEILRNGSDSDENFIIDQAGRELRELIDFRIILEQPKNDLYPEYYTNDKSELEDYYKKSFGDKDGLFRKEFEKNGQLEAMINHVRMAIRNGEKAYATRRAILIVSNTADYQPLGLVAVWAAPRTVKGKVMIDYSYTWRTVEALVGLPHSLFASVKFAEYLTERITASVKGQESVCVEMGRISYIAHSLHMFLDDENLNIVRGIVNEVSI